MLDIRTKIGAGGRIIIPSLIREKLHFSIGDEVVLHVKENELYITTIEQALRQLQHKVKARNKEKVSLVDELFATRRKEAAGE
jgi:AbrB family looped-hinge helix DNA binding protein